MADTTNQSWKLLYEAGRQTLQLRKFQEAEQSFSAALQLAEEFPAGDPRLAATLNALARVYSLQRRYLAAAALLNRLLETTERALGPRHAQVAGVLTNLAEMYTQLGQAPEELELRERVLAIRSEDANADPVALGRLRERVDELRALIAERAAAETRARAETEALAAAARAAAEAATGAPTVTPVTKLPDIEMELEAPSEPIAVRSASPMRPAVATVRPSPIPPDLAAAPWPGATASTASSTPSSSWPGAAIANQVSRPAGVPVAAESYSASPTGVEMVVEPAPFSVVPMTLSGSYPGATQLGGVLRGWRGSTKLYALAAAAVLVVGLAAARGFGGSDPESDDSRISTGVVNLANTAAQPAAPAPPTTRPADAAPLRREPRIEERERVEERRDEEERAAARTREDPRAPRAPSAAELERALRAVDGAARAIDRRTRAIADSATSVHVQGPTFGKVRVSEP